MTALVLLAEVICVDSGVYFFTFLYRWMDPTIAQRLPACDRSPVELICTSNKGFNVFSGHEVACVVWTPPNSSLRLWTSVGESLLLFCSCQKGPNEQAQCTYSTMRSGEQSFLLTTDYLWICYGFWIMPYTKSSYSVFSDFPQYEVSRHSCVTQSLSVMWSYQTSSPMSQKTFEMLVWDGEDDVCLDFYTISLRTVQHGAAESLK